MKYIFGLKLCVKLTDDFHIHIEINLNAFESVRYFSKNFEFKLNYFSEMLQVLYILTIDTAAKNALELGYTIRMNVERIFPNSTKQNVLMTTFGIGCNLYTTKKNQFWKT